MASEATIVRCLDLLTKLAGTLARSSPGRIIRSARSFFMDLFST